MTLSNSIKIAPSSIKQETERNEPAVMFETDWLGRFLNTNLREDYISYCLGQKSRFSFLIVVFMICSWSVVESVATILYYHESLDQTSIIPELLSFLLVVVVCILTPLLWRYSEAQRKDNSYRLESSAQTISTHSNIQIILIIAVNSLLLIKLIKNISLGTLNCLPADVVNKLSKAHPAFLPANTSLSSYISHDDSIPNCPDKDSFLSLVAYDMVLAMCYCPLLLMAILYEPRLYVIFPCLVVLGGFMLYSSSLSIYSLSPTSVALVIIGLLFYDLHLQRIESFQKHQQLKGFLEEQEKNADQQHALEMRHMIGNIAHDLKTVSVLIFLYFFFVKALDFAS